jgi:inward rectifier potassium channel
MSEQRNGPRLFDVDEPANVVVGLPSRVALDTYHKLLRASWPVTLSTIAGTFLLANLLFALAFVWAGGVANVRPESVLDAFFFSVQTMGTIGYGDMRPVTPLAHWLVVVEVMIGILLLAVATGLVFAKISRPTARLLFSRFAVIAPMDGLPLVRWRFADMLSELPDGRLLVDFNRLDELVPAA